MSRDIWFFSDHHFGHANILTFTDGNTGALVRPMFDNVDQMDEFMVETWNADVKPGDLVWHGGDITFDKKKFTDKILNQLHGRLRITVGNHDDIKFLAGLGRIEKLVESRRFDEFGFVYSHRPMHQEGLWNHRQNRFMVSMHGHIHQNASPSGLHLNVSVEATSYKPVHIEDVTARARAQYEAWAEQNVTT
jgi:calcineurin-like phosphoesterase family protein